MDKNIKNAKLKKYLPRSGFVYACFQVDKDGWIKVGFTRRSPSTRIKELSGTSVQDEFKLIDARFVWDCISCEKYIHNMMKERYDFKKEFFKLSKEEIIDLLDKTEKYDLDNRDKKLSSTLSLEDNYNNLEDPWSDYQFLKDIRDWKEEDYQSSKFKYEKKDSIRKIEKDALSGDPLASMFIAKSYFEDGVDEIKWGFAKCYFNAAQKQGYHLAPLFCAYYKSLWDFNSIDDFWDELYPFYKNILNQENVDSEVLELMEKEQSSWSNLPSRASSFANWLNNRQSANKIKF